MNQMLIIYFCTVAVTMLIGVAYRILADHGRIDQKMDQMEIFFIFVPVMNVYFAIIWSWTISQSIDWEDILRRIINPVWYNPGFWLMSVLILIIFLLAAFGEWYREIKKIINP